MVAGSTLPFFYINTAKETCFALVTSLALAQAPWRRVAVWAVVTILLAFSASRSPETEVAHLRLIAFSSATAFLVAFAGRTAPGELIAPLRVLSFILIFLGFDAAIESRGFFSLANFAAPLFGREPLPNPFFLLEDPETRRAASFLGNPNRLGAFAAVGLYVAIGAWRSDRRWRVAHAIAVLSAGVAVFLSYSRGAYLAVLVGALVLLFFQIRRRKLSRRDWLLVGAAGLLFAGLALPRLLVAMEEAGFRQWRDRMLIWEGSVAAIRSRPWTGWGLGGFGPAYSLHAPARWWDVIPAARMLDDPRKQMTFDAHNEYLDLGVEFGVPGLTALAFGAVIFARWIFRRLADDATKAPCVAALATAAVAAFFSSVRVAPVLMVGLLALLVLAARDGAVPINWSPRRAAIGLFLFASLLSPFLGDAYFRHAYFAKREGREAFIPDWLTLCRHLRPNDPTPWFAAARLGLPRTLESLIALAERYPGYRDVETAIAVSAAASGRADLAAEWYGRAYLLKPSPERKARWEAAAVTR